MQYNKKMVHVLIAMLLLFCSVVLYFTYFQIFKSSTLANDSANPRTYAREKTVRRGTLYDRNGTAIVESEMHEDGQTRIYPYGSRYALVTGYSHSLFGRTLLENTFNQYILGGGQADFLSTVLGVENTEGADLHLTIDNDLQKTACELLEQNTKKGAVVAIDPSSGEILAMASTPTFDPGALPEDLNALPEGSMLPRHTQGSYVPGSVFKIITAAAALENGLGAEIYDDTEPLYIDGQPIQNFENHIYGEMDLTKAFAKSSNKYFAYIADKLGAEALRNTAEAFGFNQNLSFDIPFVQSTTLKGNPNRTEVAAVGYGQGQTLTSPLHMAMVAATIANDGLMMQPYLVRNAIYGEETVYTAVPTQIRRVVSPSTAQEVGAMMEECVRTGTGQSAGISNISVAAKTGTAEIAGQPDHAWFVAFAPAENPKIALSIVWENSGRQGADCGYMARALIQKWMKANA